MKDICICISICLCLCMYNFHQFFESFLLGILLILTITQPPIYPYFPTHTTFNTFLIYCLNPSKQFVLYKYSQMCGIPMEHGQFNQELHSETSFSIFQKQTIINCSHQGRTLHPAHLSTHGPSWVLYTRSQLLSDHTCGFLAMFRRHGFLIAVPVLTLKHFCVPSSERILDLAWGPEECGVSYRLLYGRMHIYKHPSGPNIFQYLFSESCPVACFCVDDHFLQLEAPEMSVERQHFQKLATLYRKLNIEEF